MKVAIVAYDDGDPDNKRGPISSEIFNHCWEQARQPRDFWALTSELQTPILVSANQLSFEKNEIRPDLSNLSMEANNAGSR